ncbi:MAG: hypothetical protein ACRCTJ_05160, partial [Brevinema sp.]
MPGKLSEDILMIFAKKHHIKINKQTKDDLITRIRNHFPSIQKMHESLYSLLKTHPYPPSIRKVKRIILPFKNISHIQSYHPITVLPQSDSHIMIIWNVSFDEELPEKAWQIKDSFGLDIILPRYSRSVIIPIT